MSTLRYINAAQVRRLAKEVAKTRYKKFTRVSAEFLEYVNDEVRRLVTSTVMSAPTIGKTIMPPIRRKKEDE